MTRTFTQNVIQFVVGVSLLTPLALLAALLSAVRLARELAAQT